MVNKASHQRAIRMLVLCTALWGLSFPTMKALTMTQQNLLPQGSSWFFASLCVTYRFGLAALVMGLLCWRSIGRLTPSELRQGIGLGLFGGGGLLLQMDGLAHTSVSISAFLTQSYCVFIPLWIAFRQRLLPSRRTGISCLMVCAGAAILAGVDWRNLRLGRGEGETILAAVLFTGQILWLEKSSFAENNPSHFSVVMFTVMSLICLPVALLTAPRIVDCVAVYAIPVALGFLGLLILFCTLGGYVLMNRWQRHISATQAGLIYCLEPVLASFFAWFLPGWFSAWAGIAYPNETMTSQLLIGGGLILAANALILGAPNPARTCVTA